jgi:serine phosphatase RsbU (regulator of sigma subunit)
MPEIAAPVLEYIYELITRDRSPAFLLLDENGCLQDWGGSPERYGIGSLEKGKPVEEHVDALKGFFPFYEEEITLSCVRTGRGVSADIHILRKEKGYWVIFSDVSREEALQARLQQKLNDMTLLRDRSEKMIEKMTADGSLPAEIFLFLDMAVMECTPDGSFHLIGEIPQCLKSFFPDVLPGKKGFRPDEEFPFLENFLFEAREWWSENRPGKLGSGQWSETDPLGNECEFEAYAICLGNRKILVIAPACYSYQEKQAFIQKSRELSLAYHRLAQTEAELSQSKEIAEDANAKIISSIRYAKMIQQSMLPNPENIRYFLPESFFIWMPRDIVGGDFIFTACVRDRFIIAVIDCTGHGVPGAFMTMVAGFAMRRIIEDEGGHDPAQILKRLSFLVRTSLQQDTLHSLSDDGLDAAIVSIGLPVWGQVTGCRGQVAGDRLQGTGCRGQVTGDKQVSCPATCDLQPATCDLSPLIFAGAKLPLYYMDTDEVTVIKGNRKSIGYRRSDPDFDFTNHNVPVRKGMSFYIATDGFTDQLGEKDQRRLGTRRFIALLNEKNSAPFIKQRSRLLRAFYAHKGKNEIQDDVTVVGFCFNE